MDYLELAKDVVARAASGGAEAEAYIEIGSQSEITVDRQEVEKLSYSGSKGLGLRVIKNGRMGYAYTSNFDEGSLTATVEAAHALMEAVDADEFVALPKAQNDARENSDDDLGIYDASIAEMSMDERVAFALEVERAALDYSDKVAMTNRCTYIDQTGTVCLANSHGFADSYRASVVVAFVIAIGRDGSEQTQAYGIGGKTALADISARQIGRQAGERATRLLGGKPVPTQRATVVFDPVVTAQLLGTLASALNADAMQRGRSFLASKMGQEVACDMVTILDNGRLHGGLGSRPFDSEGVPTRATRLIDEGTLQAVTYDTYSANRAGTTSTGNATRQSHRTPPGVGPSNFYMQPGPQSPEEIIGGVENGFFVINAMNTGGINPVAGEWSSAASGLWIRDGKLAEPVNEVTIAATLPEMLNGITAVGNDLTFVPFYGNVGASTVRIKEMTVGGM